MRQRRSHRLTRGGLSAVAVGLLFSTPPSNAQEVGSPTDLLVHMHTPPDEFVLSEKTERKVLEYDSDRLLTVCLNELPSMEDVREQVMDARQQSIERLREVKLEIQVGEEALAVPPGMCGRVVTSKATLRPSTSLPPGWDLTGTIHSQEPATAGDVPEPVQSGELPD